MKLVHVAISGILTLVLLGMLSVVGVVYYFTKDLPDYTQLEEYNPPVVTRFYSADAKVMEEYARERRIFVPISAMPDMLIKAFLAAEDRNFYNHPGVDVMSVLRAAMQNVMNIGTGKSLIGGSTITQQVVKNFLLSNERTLTRKIREAILAYRISQVYSKDRILELYLNEIYLGNRSYGVAAAALYYFNKSLDQLDLEEAALLAALPKAPSSYDPTRNYADALERRNWVLRSMAEEGLVPASEALAAMEKPIQLRERDPEQRTHASFFSEEVRRTLAKEYGEQKLYQSGLSVHTTLKPELQTMARDTLREGLLNYDRRHGYRGPITNLSGAEDWQAALVKVDVPDMAPDAWQRAVVLSTSSEKAQLGLTSGERTDITMEGVEWARPWVEGQKVVAKPEAVSDVLNKGDVILIAKNADDVWELKQVPDVSGAIVVMDAHTGKVLAMQGGFSFSGSQFNRATQALRQPGSAFKPFAYLAALEQNYTPATLVNDEPIELYWGSGENLQIWTPQNYSGDYYGPTTLRRGLEFSRNVMTVQLALNIGINKITEVAERFDINDKLPQNFSTVLGAAETTLLRLTNAYAMLVNGGKRVDPVMVDRIYDRNGILIYRNDTRSCPGCQPDAHGKISRVPPEIKDDRERVTHPIYAYQMVSMMEGVVKRGTARKASNLGFPLGGKTGTTNDTYDAWFVGFSPNYVTGVYVGFDNPRTLGDKETGSSVALPIFMDFMKQAEAGKSHPPFPIPPGIKMTRIDYHTGYLPNYDTPEEDIIYEAFRAGSEPTYAMGWNDIYDPVSTSLTIQAPAPLGENPESPTQPQQPKRRVLDENPVTLGTGGIY